MPYPFKFKLESFRYAPYTIPIKSEKVDIEELKSEYVSISSPTPNKNSLEENNQLRLGKIEIEEIEVKPLISALLFEAPEVPQEHFTCSLCGMHFEDNQMLTCHIIAHVGNNYEYHKAKSVLYLKNLNDSYIPIINKLLTKKVSSCPDCNKLFVRRRPLEDHFRIDHRLRTLRECFFYSVGIASTNFFRQLFYSRPWNGNPYQCLICNTDFNTRISLSSHVDSHLNNNFITESHHIWVQPKRIVTSEFGFGSKGCRKTAGVLNTYVPGYYYIIWQDYVNKYKKLSLTSNYSYIKNTT